MKEVKQIEALHDCSGASMHELASLIQHMRDGPEKEQLRDLIEADIERYVHVPLEAKARCVRDYVQREAAAQLIKPMLKTLKTEVRAAKAAKDAAAREMDDFDRSVRRRVARDVLGIFPGQLFLHVCGGCTYIHT